MTMDTPHLHDEVLSASVDGEADAAARDHLAGCAACVTRRDRLAETRATLRAAPVEPVDEVTRRRILAAATSGPVVAAGRRQAWHRRPILAGGVAAVLLALLAAVPFLTGDDSAGTTAGTTALELAGGEFLGDLGELSDPSALTARLGRRSTLALPEAASEADAAARAAQAPPAAPAPVAGGQDEISEGYSATSGATADAVGEDAGTGASPEGDDRTVADACARGLASGEARGAALVAVATGTYRGQPAVVAVFDGADGRIAYIASPEGCRLLTRYRV